MSYDWDHEPNSELRNEQSLDDTPLPWWMAAAWICYAAVLVGLVLSGFR